MSLRVGRCTYGANGKRTDPSYPGFTNILVLMQSHSRYFPLSPYYLKDSEGRIFENIYQAHKVYEKVPKVIQHYSRWDKRIIWEHPEEVHICNNKLTPEYFQWRSKLMNCENAIRYPVGYHHRRKCVGSILKSGDSFTKLDYVDARKKIYVPLYQQLAREQPIYKSLLERLRKGENLLIIEVDGPHQESLKYYQETYSVPSDFIENNTMLVNEDNLNIMLNDTVHPYGHGYCLAEALMKDKNKTIQILYSFIFFRISS